jgi:hypothetical protein
MITVKVTGDPIFHEAVFLSQCLSQNHMADAMQCEYPFRTATRHSNVFCVQINSSQDFINGPFPTLSVHNGIA